MAVARCVPAVVIASRQGVAVALLAAVVGHGSVACLWRSSHVPTRAPIVPQRPPPLLLRALQRVFTRAECTKINAVPPEAVAAATW